MQIDLQCTLFDKLTPFQVGIYRTQFPHFAHLETLQLKLNSVYELLFRIDRPLVHLKRLEIRSGCIGYEYEMGLWGQRSRVQYCFPNLAELEISEFSSIEKFASSFGGQRPCGTRKKVAKRVYEKIVPLFDVEKLTVQLAYISPGSICAMIDKLRVGSGETRGRLKEAVVSSVALDGDSNLPRNKNSRKLRDFKAWVKKTNRDAAGSVRVTWTQNQPGSSILWHMLTVECKFPDEHE